MQRIKSREMEGHRGRQPGRTAWEHGRGDPSPQGEMLLKMEQLCQEGRESYGEGSDIAQKLGS